MNEHEFAIWADSLGEEGRIQAYLDFHRKRDEMVASMYPTAEMYTVKTDEIREEVWGKWIAKNQKEWSEEVAGKHTSISLVPEEQGLFGPVSVTKNMKFSYQQLFTYISDNFVLSEYRNSFMLICNLHGEVKDWRDGRPTDKEYAGVVGLHMDRHDHDEWKAPLKPPYFTAPSIGTRYIDNETQTTMVWNGKEWAEQ